MRLLAIFSALIGAGTVFSASNNTPVTFVTCPIYRDTDSGRKSGCWLADDPATQIRYDVSAAPMKPLVGKQILVEGLLSDDSNACGGISLRPVRTSTLNTTCEPVLIPAEGFPGRRFAVPPDVLRPTWEAKRLPLPPYVTTEFQVFFDQNSDFLIYQHAEIAMEKAALYAQASGSLEVKVVGYAATQPFIVSGQRLQESKVLARSRAEAVRMSLERLGIPDSHINVSTNTRGDTRGERVESPYAPTANASLRRVTIRVIPVQAK